jgi:hypothetical protein
VSDRVGPPPGWYADPSGEPQYRWWDGTVWQDATQELTPSPGFAPVAYRFDPSIDTWTLNAWLISLSPAGMIIGRFGYLAFGGAGGQESGGSALGSAFLLVLVYAMILLPVVFGFFDYRTLVQRGFDRPFHWAWGFFGAIVYVIGRAAVAKQRTGHGLAPMVVFFATVVLAFGVSAATAGMGVSN